MIWKGVEEGRRGSVSRLQSKEIASLPGWVSKATEEMPPYVEEFEVT